MFPGVYKAFMESGVLPHIKKDDRVWNIREGDEHKQQFAKIFCEKVLMSGEVKLIIFDLDNTMWKGEIAEAGIILEEEKLAFVKKLVKAGIMVSICSRNDFATVQKFLQSINMWEYFIFPEINTFQSKGPMVKNILSNCNLRSQNCLFVDDELRNRNEVWHANVPCLGLHPDLFWLCLLEDFDYDKGGEQRLLQYKVMEKKHQYKNEGGLSTEEFLRRSAIKVTIQDKEIEALAPRLEELFSRANQLNFTKTRLKEGEILAALSEPNVQAGAIHVKDLFGNYGVAGFFLLSEGELKHFVFSCRVLGMNVETAVYQYLGKPKLVEIQPTAVQNLSDKSHIDYVDIQIGMVSEDGGLIGSKYITIKGSCWTVTISAILASRVKYNFTILPYDNPDPYGLGHSDSIAFQLREDKTNLDFLDKYCDFAIQDVQEGYLIFQPWREADVLTFKHKHIKDLYIPFGDTKSSLVTNRSEFISKNGLSEEFVQKFEENFEVAGVMTPERLYANIQLMHSKLPKGVTLIIQNFNDLKKGPDDPHHALHCSLNECIDKIVRDYEDIKLMDCRGITLEDIVKENEVFSLKREVNVRLASQLADIINLNDAQNNNNN